MGSLLLHSDLQLRQFTQFHDSSNSDQISNALRYLNHLISNQLDINGDEVVTTEEMLQALSYRNLVVNPSLKMWCKNASEGGYCYEDKNPTAINVEDLYNDMVFNFLNSYAHTFDGSGSPIVSSISSTFPNSSWSDSDCRQHSSLNGNSPQVVTSWAFTDSALVKKLCGYVNGYFSAPVTISDVSAGTFTSFIDTEVSSFPSKKVYCIYVTYVSGCTEGASLDANRRCPSGTEYTYKSSYSCSVGLFYVRMHRVNSLSPNHI